MPDSFKEPRIESIGDASWAFSDFLKPLFSRFSLTRLETGCGNHFKNLSKPPALSSSSIKHQRFPK